MQASGRNILKRIPTPIFVILGIVAAVGLYVLFTHWHPLWRYQAGYVSQAQFGEDWPFTVPEAKVVCYGNGEMVLLTSAGAYGLTSGMIGMGYQSLEQADIWKLDPNGWKQRVPADKFWVYVNTLCK